MECGATLVIAIGKGRAAEKSRRSWIDLEEEVLIHSLRDIIAKGWKSENGFKAGYLAILENEMQAAIPGINLRGNPHINSKIHEWKKMYGTLVTFLSKSRVGWNNKDKSIEANEETWESMIQADSNFEHRGISSGLIMKIGDMFGNDRTMGEQPKTFENALHDVLKLSDDSLMGYTQTSKNIQMADESISNTNTPLSKPTDDGKCKKKRKKSNDIKESLVLAIKKLADITKSSMGELIKQLAAAEKLSDTQDEVLDALQGLEVFSDDEQLRAAQLLYNNHNDLALFKHLGEMKRIIFIKRLLRGE